MSVYERLVREYSDQREVAATGTGTRGGVAATGCAGKQDVDATDERLGEAINGTVSP